MSKVKSEIAFTLQSATPSQRFSIGMQLELLQWNSSELQESSKASDQPVRQRQRKISFSIFLLYQLGAQTQHEANRSAPKTRMMVQSSPKPERIVIISKKISCYKVLFAFSLFYFFVYTSKVHQTNSHSWGKNILGLGKCARAPLDPNREQTWICEPTKLVPVDTLSSTSLIQAFSVVESWISNDSSSVAFSVMLATFDV